MKRNNRGNWSLIGLLVAVGVIAVAMYFYLGNGVGPSSVKSDSKLLDSASTKKTTFGKAMDTAKGADCQEHLRQVRYGIEMFKNSSTEGSFPPSLKDAGLSVGTDYFKCPVSNQPYTYDPASGAVRCPYAGHANF